MFRVHKPGSWVVSCGSCALVWKRPDGLTDYEQQSLESRPCPGCGAYTLGCSAPQRTQTRRETREARSTRAA